jgi:thioesterase domain-containing protein
LASAPSLIVPIKPEGRRRPVFAVSGHGGDVYSLLGLARHLDADQPVLGVQPPGLDGSDPLTTVDALARYQIEQIRQVQPEGPYLIAGHCAGGTIAFEVAQQLTAAGQTIGLLALIGAPYPKMFRTTPQMLLYFGRHAKALTSGSIAERTRYVVSKLQDRLKQSEPQPDVNAEASAARQRVERATVVAVSNYVPQPYAGDIDVFVTAEKWHRAHYWQEIAANAREHVIAGFGVDELLAGPDVGLLATALQQRLDGGFR